MKTVVLGTGGWGTALSLVLCDNGHETVLWSHNSAKAAEMAKTRENPLLRGVILPEKLQITGDLDCLEGADLVSAIVHLSPPDVTLELDRTEMEELAGLLREVVVYRRDDSWTEYTGQAVTYTLELADGRTCTVTDYNPFLSLDGVGYRTKYEPCEALNSFGNRLLRGYP